MFKLGDVVRVRGRATRMTVEHVYGNNEVRCCWFHEYTLHRADFPVAGLVHAPTW